MLRSIREAARKPEPRRLEGDVAKRNVMLIKKCYVSVQRLISVVKLFQLAVFRLFRALQ